MTGKPKNPTRAKLPDWAQERLTKMIRTESLHATALRLGTSTCTLTAVLDGGTARPATIKRLCESLEMVAPAKPMTWGGPVLGR